MKILDIPRIFGVDPTDEEQMAQLADAIAEALWVVHEEAKCLAS
jgi:hypothetical protein